jgi:hypothetical protein
MSEGAPSPQINFSKIQGAGGVAGAMVAVMSTLIFLLGIPLLRYFLPAAIVLGGAVALFIRFKRHETPGKPWILVSAKQADSGTVTDRGDTSTRRTLIPSVNFS